MKGRRLGMGLLVGAVSALALAPASALATQHKGGKADAPIILPGCERYRLPGCEHLKFRFGPVQVTPGTNWIFFNSAANPPPKPTVPGFMVKNVPGLFYAVGPHHSQLGAVPNVGVVHLHHGVFIHSQTGEKFAGTGEEKTVFWLPYPYGYPVAPKDIWELNYMFHNLTEKTQWVYLTYEMDFVPTNTPLGQKMKEAHPIWMDVEGGHNYPVFDVHKGTGTNGQITFPDQFTNPYADRTAKTLARRGLPNEWTVKLPGTLIGTAGHLHPGGLYDTLDIIRPGATIAKAARWKDGVPSGPVPGAEPNSVLAFRSFAHYWDPNGPISWDMAMGGTSPKWQLNVQPGDILRISAAYDTKRASWYEDMGIMVVWWTPNDVHGVDPFTTPVDLSNHLTHSRLPENISPGGESIYGAVNPATLKSKILPSGSTVQIQNFEYAPGSLFGANSVPTVHPGQQLNFVNQDASLDPADVLSIYHSITACRLPCDRTAGISYPLADGAGGFDSGQLGFGPGDGLTPSVQRVTWSTPADLPPGTYTYYCRIHPFMRGVFRIATQ